MSSATGLPPSSTPPATAALSRRQFLRLSCLAGLSAAALPLLEACGPTPQALPTSAPTAKPEAPTAAPAAKPAAPAAKTLPQVRFLSSPAGLGDWPVYVGLEKKLFEEDGVQVDFSPTAPATITQAVISGQADVATFSITAAVSAALQNAPMKLCMATQMALPDRKYNSWWCSLPGSAIQKPADLKGKIVHIFAPNSLAQITTRTILRKHGVLPGEYQEVSFTFDQAYTAIKTGLADAALFVEPFWTTSNRLAVQEYGKEMQIIYSQLDAFPTGMHLSGMLANTNFMAQNGDPMRRLLRTHAKAAKWGYENPDELKQIIAKHAGVPHETIKDMIIADQSTDGKWIPGFLRQLQEYMIIEKTVPGLTEPLPDERLVETAYLPTT